jgi:hypothetical protein
MAVISRDRATGIIAVSVGLILAGLTTQLPPSKVPDDVGPRVFPFFAAAVMVATGTGLILQKDDKTKKKTGPYFTKEEWIRFGKLFGLYLLYFVLLWAFGFIIATLITMYIVCSLFAQGKNVAVWQRVLFSVILTSLIYFSFYTMLGLKLPLGKFIKLII